MGDGRISMKGAAKISPGLRDEAAAWCARLAHDRGQPAWSIRFTKADIKSSPATQLAWQARGAVQARLGRDAPPQRLWTEAAALLRTGWGDHVVMTKNLTKGKEQLSMAKKQTRRSISVSRKVFERAQAFAAEKGVSLAQLTEAALAHAVEHFYRNDGNHA